MRRVGRARAEVQVERLVRVDLLGVGDEPDGLVDQIRCQVVALLRGGRRIDLVVVVDEVGMPLARVAAEEPVEALEAAAERPPIVGTGPGLLARRDQVPLAHHVGVEALAEQDLRQEAVLERHVAVVAGEPGGELGHAGHVVAVVVAAGDDARSARRAQRGGVHVVVAQPVGGDRVEVRRLDRAAEAAQLPEPGVVEHDEQHVGCALRRPLRHEPGRARLVGRAPGDTRELLPLVVLDQTHLRSSIVVSCSGQTPSRAASRPAPIASMNAA